MEDFKKNEAEKRMEEVKKAFAISVSGAKAPTENTIKNVRKYIEGKEELSRVQEEIVKEYDENDR